MSDKNNKPEDMLTLGNRFIIFVLILLSLALLFSGVDDWVNGLK